MASEIKIGQKAPSFKAKAQNGETLQLKDFKGQRLILYFYPKDLTPGCTVEAQDFQSHLSQFRRKKVAVVGVSRDDEKKHDKFIEKYSLEFPLLSDENGEICEAYHVWKKKKFMGKEYMGIERTTFVISPQGEIEKIYEKIKVKDHVKTILEDLA